MILKHIPILFLSVWSSQPMKGYFKVTLRIEHVRGTFRNEIEYGLLITIILCYVFVLFIVLLYNLDS